GLQTPSPPADSCRLSPMPGLSGGAGPDSIRQQNCAELSRPSYIVYSATTDPTRDRTERFTCLRFVHPGMLHEKSHLKCPIGQTLAKSNEKWTSNLRNYTICWVAGGGRPLRLPQIPA